MGSKRGPGREAFRNANTAKSKFSLLVDLLFFPCAFNVAPEPAIPAGPCRDWPMETMRWGAHAWDCQCGRCYCWLMLACISCGCYDGCAEFVRNDVLMRQEDGRKPWSPDPSPREERQRRQSLKELGVTK